MPDTCTFRLYSSELETCLEQTATHLSDEKITCKKLEEMMVLSQARHHAEVESLQKKINQLRLVNEELHKNLVSVVT